MSSGQRHLAGIGRPPPPPRSVSVRPRPGALPGTLPGVAPQHLLPGQTRSGQAGTSSYPPPPPSAAPPPPPRRHITRPPTGYPSSGYPSSGYPSADYLAAPTTHIPPAPRAPSFAPPSGYALSSRPPPAPSQREAAYRDPEPSIEVEFDEEAPPAPKTVVRSKSSRPPSEAPSGQSNLTPSLRAYVAATTSNSTISGSSITRTTSRNPRRRRARIIRGLVVFLTMGAGVFLGGAFIGGVLAPEAEMVSTVQPLEYDADELEVPEVEPLPLIERAAQGQDSALLELDLKDPEEKTFEEILALAEGRERRDQQEAHTLGEEFLSTSPGELSRDTVERLMLFAGEPFTYREAQVAFAKYPHVQGPDWLYRVTRRYRHRKEVVLLAEELLAMKEVRQNASPALKVVIESWDVDSCDGARDLLQRALQVGDNRSIRHLAKFAQKDGCGSGQAEDCYPCLREDNLLVDALRAAQRRRAPR